jgi:2-methylisocitrate lyase-like PEP mutase family enzyme
MATAAKALRELLEGGRHFIAAEAYSALTGRIVERVGFKAAYLGGHACSAFHYAMPDVGIFSQVEQLEQAARITAAIDIPLIVDADTLGETVADAFHFTRRYERAGVAGIHVEDEVNPKHSAYANGLLPVADMQARLAACLQARRDPDFVVIARCDELYPIARGGGGSGELAAAIARGRAYAEAGADALVYPLATEAQCAELRAALPVPLIGSGHPIEANAATLCGGWGWMGAARLHMQLARELMETGRVAGVARPDEQAALLEEDLFAGLIGDWAEKTGRPRR